MQIKARLLDFSHIRASSPVNEEVCIWRSTHFQDYKSIRKNSDTYVSKPGVVLIGKHDCTYKIKAILQDNTKFHKIDSVESHDLTDKTESRIQQGLWDLVERNRLSKMKGIGLCVRSDLVYIVCLNSTTMGCLWDQSWLSVVWIRCIVDWDVRTCCIISFE